AASALAIPAKRASESAGIRFAEGPFAEIRFAEGRAASALAIPAKRASESAGIRFAEGPFAEIRFAEGRAASALAKPANQPSAFKIPAKKNLSVADFSESTLGIRKASESTITAHTPNAAENPVDD
ncbi:MAG: hypothetical protein IKG22_00750, partial [Atopobiaceae bacterium]|nr:hypothetical protein [Atopobiaceae bacterium]